MSHYWTRHEDEILEEYYPDLGARGLEAKLPDRTYDAIMMRAQKRGIRYDPPVIVQITEAKWWELIPNWRAAEPANDLRWRIAA